MIYTGLKYQGETPLDYQYTLKKNEGQEGKIDFFQGWVIVGEGWASMGSGWA
jgi:hypothetical protein